jgi:hypothetical protein
VAALIDIVYYLLKNYPHKHALSDERVAKMIYLADWRSALRRGRQISDIEWFFDGTGPFVRDIDRAVAGNPLLISKRRTKAAHYASKNILTISKGHEPGVSEEEKLILDFVIDYTKERDWDNFIRLVYSTYPALTSDRYDSLDLVKNAERFHMEREPAA